MSFWALLQVVARQPHPIHLVVYSEDGDEAHLWLEGGALTDAVLRRCRGGDEHTGLEGESVVETILDWNEGYFFVRPEAPAQRRGIPVEIVALLTRAALRRGRELGSVRGLEASLAPGSSGFGLGPEAGS